MSIIIVLVFNTTFKFALYKDSDSYIAKKEETPARFYLFSLVSCVILLGKYFRNFKHGKSSKHLLKCSGWQI